jgi:pimeloyl-ACP methyl ester carboxylesterase
VSELRIDAGGVALSASDDGEGIPVVLLHGLTASRRYVVMGSRALERSGHRTIAYDARGHGASAPAPSPDAYVYDLLRADLVAVLDALGLDRAVLAGASMGAHTALRLALEEPERVAAVVAITPSFDPDEPPDLERWDALADSLRERGVEGFVEAYGLERRVPEAWRDTLRTVLRQRLAVHEHPEAVADALRAVPRSQPFASLDALRDVRCPTIVVADRDEADPGHPLRVGERYAGLIPDAKLIVEDEGRSPIAWQGGQLSRIIAELAGEASG